MEFLRAQYAKAVVVACNTATGIAVDALRARYTQPMLRSTCRQTRSCPDAFARRRRPGDDADAGGSKFAKLVSTHAGDVEVLTQPCPAWLNRSSEEH